MPHLAALAAKTQYVRNLVNYSSDNIALNFHGRAFFLFLGVILYAHFPS